MFLRFEAGVAASSGISECRCCAVPDIPAIFIEKKEKEWLWCNSYFVHCKVVLYWRPSFSRTPPTINGPAMGGKCRQTMWDYSIPALNASRCNIQFFKDPAPLALPHAVGPGALIFLNSARVRSLLLSFFPRTLAFARPFPDNNRCSSIGGVDDIFSEEQWLATVCVGQ